MSTSEPERLYDLGSDSEGPIPHLPIPRRRETPEQRATRIKEAVDALRQLAEMGAFDHIEDPGEWQRVIREDRPLPGRDY